MGIRQSMRAVGQCTDRLDHLPARRRVLYSRSAQISFLHRSAYTTGGENVINQIAIEQMRAIQQTDVKIFPTEGLSPALCSFEISDSLCPFEFINICVEIKAISTVCNLFSVTRREQVNQVSKHEVDLK